jgi:hypothetical protein
MISAHCIKNFLQEKAVEATKQEKERKEEKHIVQILLAHIVQILFPKHLGNGTRVLRAHLVLLVITLRYWYYTIIPSRIPGICTCTCAPHMLVDAC